MTDKTLQHDPKNAIEDDEMLGEDEIDVEAAPPPSDEELKSVATIAAEYLTIESEIVSIEETLKAKKLALKAIAEISLPLAMTTVGMTEFKLVGGAIVEIEDILTGSLTQANKEKGHAWLEENGHGDLIKHELKITFGRGDEKLFAKFMRDLAKRKTPIEHERKDAVAPQTLAAFVREQIRGARAEGKDPAAAIPTDIFSVYEAKVANVFIPKPKKPRAKKEKADDATI